MHGLFKTSEKRRLSNRRDFLKNRLKYNANRRLKYATNAEYREKILYRQKKRLRFRFNILQRDNFTCQYCGRKSPDVVLEVDHILPKSKGGLDQKENYITACYECNRGKGDIILKKLIYQ